jgi:hypothetical protein
VNDVVEPGQVDSSDVDLISKFHHSAIECNYGFVEATQAHENNDPELFMVSADHAIKAWIEAYATYTRLVQVLGNAPVLRDAQLGLDQ